MIHSTFRTEGAKVEYSRFDGVGRGEIHAVISPHGVHTDFRSMSDAVTEAVDAFVAAEKASGRDMVPVMRRFYLDDPVNQIEILSPLMDGSCSVVGQPPVNGARLVLFVIFVENAEVAGCDGMVEVRRGKYSDFWYMPRVGQTDDTYICSQAVLHDLSAKLKGRGMSMAESCVRTWYYVRDIDARYGGMVRARNEVFAEEGLTASTHFIASTGIGALQPSACQPLTFEALSTKGLERGQMTYLKAATNLNRTTEYGVAFERGTSVEYGDRQMIYVSGTASIDNCGQIVAPGNVRAQACRMADNVEALLSEAGAGGNDLMHIVLYLRNYADAGMALSVVSARFPDIPCVCVLGPVCRPGWLVEMECQACVPSVTSAYAPY